MTVEARGWREARKGLQAEEGRQTLEAERGKDVDSLLESRVSERNGALPTSLFYFIHFQKQI